MPGAPEPLAKAGPPRAWWRSDAGAVTLLVTIFLGVNWRLIAGQVAEHWDAETFYAPLYSHLAQLTRHGHLLLWNPLNGGGSPDFAEPQIGAFSPVTLLFGLLAGPSLAAFRCYWLGVWLFGGLGMYVLARALAAPPWGALVTSLGFVLSGFYLGHAEHVSIVYCYSFVPWTLWRLRAALVAGQRWPAVQAGALWGLAALAGNPAITIPAALFFAVVALAWTRADAPWTARTRDYVVAMLLLAAVGIVVMAPSYFSFRHEVVGYSERSLPLPRARVLPAQSLNFRWLTTLASPLIALATRGSKGWPKIDICYLPVYFGAAMPVLAGFALWQGRRRWRPWAVLLAGVLFLGFTLGQALPLRGWLYDLVPATRYFRHNPMFRGFFIVAIAMLAACGAGVVEAGLARAEDEGSRLRALAWIAGAFAAISAGAFAWVFGASAPLRASPWRFAAALEVGIAWLGLAACCCAALRGERARRSLPAALALLTALDMTAAFAISEGLVYDERPTSGAAEVQPAVEFGSAGFARTRGASNTMGNLYANEAVYSSYSGMVNRYYEAWQKDPALLRAAVGAQRVWFAAQAPSVPLAPETFSAFQRRAHEVDGLIIVRHSREAMLEPGGEASAKWLNAIAETPPAVKVSCEVQRYRSDELSLKIICPANGFIMLTDRWSRSWKARVNGQVTRIEGGDFLFRLVPVIAGENVIEMEFKPLGRWPLLTMSWGTLALVGTVSLRRRWQSSAAGAPVVRESVLVPAGASEACVAA